MEAITRKEMFMDAAAKGDASGLPVPVTREEMYLYIKASGDTAGILEPITRREIFWHAMCIGDASGLPAPVTREELFLLAAATGETEGLPEPITRMEIYLEAIAEAGGGGGGDKPWEEMTWDEVIAATKNGKYKSFEIGAMKELDLGTEGIVHMQVVGIDVDDLADGSGKAPLTFISHELLNTSHRMNPARTPSSAPYDEGTGSIGGWEKCEMRAYLKEIVKPLIPENVRNAIVNVTKYSNIFNTSGTKVLNNATTDDVWIPSNQELFGGTSYESSGHAYSIFSSNDSRKKSKVGATSASYWWLRSARNGSTFYGVLSTGDNSNSSANNSFGVALGFCL